MAGGESLQDRTEAATPRKRKDAHDKGQVPRSQELTTALLLLAAGGLLWAMGPFMTGTFARLLSEGTMRAGTPLAGAGANAEWIRGIARQTATATAPLFGGLALTGLILAAAQARGVLSAQPIQPDWSRIAPHKNISRIWGVRALAELAKSLFKLGIVGGALFLTLRHAWSDILTLGQQDPAVLAHWLGRFAIRLLFTAGSTYLFLAAADYAFQLWQHEKQLRMTKDEVRQELKESEGDPQNRARLRNLGRALVRKQMFKDVTKADVVVTNPTHIAVALQYDPLISIAPIVLAMGERKVAERIKKLAYESGVPVIEDKPLARALFAAGRVGLPIPPELYVAVAEVLAFVYKRRRGMATEAWQGSTSA